jgi:predicted transcriptional regulator
LGNTMEYTMVAMLLKLTDRNKQKLEELSRRTGKSADDLANEAIERLSEASESEKPTTDWKAGIMQAAGMWKDREDIPELMEQLRREWNRVAPPEDPK